VVAGGCEVVANVGAAGAFVVVVLVAPDLRAGAEAVGLEELAQAAAETLRTLRAATIAHLRDMGER
jgi:hypothetical protein